ncbi:hypothetical protein R6Q59_022320 [Mikania micrantha]
MNDDRGRSCVTRSRVIGGAGGAMESAGGGVRSTVGRRRDRTRDPSFFFIQTHLDFVQGLNYSEADSDVFFRSNDMLEIRVFLLAKLGIDARICRFAVGFSIIAAFSVSFVQGKFSVQLVNPFHQN